MPFYQYLGEKFLRKFKDNGQISVLAFFVFVEIISTGYIVIPRNPRAWYSVDKDLTVGRNIHHNLIAGFKLFPNMSQTIHQGPKTISALSTVQPTLLHQFPQKSVQYKKRDKVQISTMMR